MSSGDEVLQVQQPAQRRDQQQHHGEARQQRAEHEERRELRRVPSGGGGSGEIQSDNAVHGDDERRHDRRQHAVCRVIVPPLDV